MKETILQLQRAFDQAELSADTDQLRRLLADDFAGIGPKGFVLDKSAWIRRHEQFKYRELESTDIDLQLYDGAAIVRNIQRNRAVYHGQELEHRVRVAQVWVKSRDAWRLASIQFSPMEGP